MTEIEKMFENVGFKKREIENCTYKNSTPCGHSCDDGEDCPYLEIKIDYPPFTAKKQTELIKFLLDKYCDIRIRKNLEGAYYITSFNDISCFSEDFEETLASFTNTHLQDLTDQEKEEIRSILDA